MTKRLLVLLVLPAFGVGTVPGVCATELAAQESVRSVRLVADLTARDGSAEVRMDIVLADADTVGSTSAMILDFGRATAGDVRTGAGGDAVDLLRGAGLARSVRLPVEHIDGEARTQVTYQVEHATVENRGAVRGHLPVLGVRLRPERTLPGLFEAELRLPPEWRVLEGFPTGMTATGEPGVYRVDLQVVPSLLSFRARSDGAWRPGLPLVLDVLGLGLLLAFSVVGWRYMRSPA